MEAPPPHRGLLARLLMAIVVAITMPLWLLAAVLFFASGGGVAIGMAPYSRWRDAQMRRKLVRAGRVISWDEVERAAAKGGALVTDYPFAGWHALRVWWTSDDVEYAIPDDDAEIVIDRQHKAYIDRYASPDSASAILVAGAHGGAAVKALEQRITATMARCPALKRATLASGLLSMYAEGGGSSRPPVTGTSEVDPSRSV